MTPANAADPIAAMAQMNVSFVKSSLRPSVGILTFGMHVSIRTLRVTDQENDVKSVVVTGVGGYIAKYVAAESLQSGYAVTGTVRATKRADGIRSVIGVRADTSNLSFAEADHLADAGWKELIAPAVEGTQRILPAAEDAGVQRVVVTSSVFTLCMWRPWNRREPPANG